MAIKGLGGFHLAVDAMNEAAVARLRERKRARGEAVRHHGAHACRRWKNSATWMMSPATLLQSPAHPIVLLRKKQPERLAPSVAPFNRDLGVFLPYTPLHHLLFAEERFHGAGDDERQHFRRTHCH